VGENPKDDDQETVGHGGRLPPLRACFPLLGGGPNFMSVYPAPHHSPTFLVIRSLPCFPASYRITRTVVSFCARHDPPQNPTVGPVECHMVISSVLRFLSLGHPPTIKGNTSIFARSSSVFLRTYERRRGVPKEGDRNRPAPVPRPTDLGSERPVFRRL